MTRPVLVLCALCVALGGGLPTRASQTAAPKSRITTASGVRVRKEPRTGAEEVGRLRLGVVVGELERSAQRERVGEAEDYWFRVAAPNGVEGWVFGGLTAAFDAGRREEIYRQLAAARVANASATFAELSDLVVFLERAVKEVTRREALAELELARLVALQRSLASIGFEDLEKPPYSAWTKEREAEIVYSEPAGQWYVRAELFWDLQRKYQDVPAVAERIAWEGAQAPLPGECEGYLPCHLYALKESEGRYLRLYPRGPHAEAALNNIAEFFDSVSQDAAASNPVYEVPQEDRADFQKSLAELRAGVAPVQHALRERVLTQLDELARRFR
ncbi:MAG TPA: SH3 domain-containing protein [Pyrinomonadaceae bacterium]|nr:SH3 domain-containing protein [Pyrinomonadaceae bacterium]